MSVSKTHRVEPGAVALNDFYKTNGLPADQVATHFSGPSMTRQEFAEECDINNIMKRYDAYLADPMRSIREPRYYDFSSMPGTLMEAMDVLRAGEEAFMTLPAEVRRHFDNDPAAFVDYASDPGSLDQMREWGLAAPQKVEDEPLRVQVVGDGWKPIAEPTAGSEVGGDAPPAPPAPPVKPGGVADRARPSPPPPARR